MEIANNIYFSALGLTLLHSLWQGTLIGMLFYIAKNLFQKHPARLRFEIGAFALVAQLILSIATFTILISGVPSGQAALESGMLTGPIEVLTSTEINNAGIWLGILGLIWMIGMIISMLRLSTGWWQTKQIKNSADLLGAKWSNMVKSLSGKMGIDQPVQILETLKINVPVTLGYFKPVILFPVGMINQLDVKEVEAIIAHELAHIKNNDYLFNLIFSFIEALFYFHPIIWWISNEMNDAREESCDEMAILALGDRMQYAKTLVRVEEASNFYLNTSLALSGKKGRLRNRIYKILNRSNPHLKENNQVFGFVLIGVLVSLFLVGSLQAKQKEISPDTLTPANEVYSAEYEQEKEIIIVAELMNDSRDDQEITVTNDAEDQYRVQVRRVNLKDNPSIENYAFFSSDTIPLRKKKEVYSYSYSSDGKQNALKMKNGEITYLKIDGKEIPEDQYAEYKDEIFEMKNQVPAPPKTPMPPTAPKSPNFNAPPAPPSPPSAPKPPSPERLMKDLSIFELDGDWNGFHFDSTFVFDGNDFDFDFHFDVEELEALKNEMHLNAEEWEKQLHENLEKFKEMEFHFDFENLDLNEEELQKQLEGMIEMELPEMEIHLDRVKKMMEEMEENFDFEKFELEHREHQKMLEEKLRQGHEEMKMKMNEKDKEKDKEKLKYKSRKLKAPDKQFKKQIKTTSHWISDDGKIRIVSLGIDPNQNENIPSSEIKIIQTIRNQETRDSEVLPWIFPLKVIQKKRETSLDKKLNEC